MADRTFYPAFNYGFARVYLEFTSPAPVTTSAPLIAGTVGVDTSVISSITKGATGVYTYLLGVREHYAKVVYATCDVDGTAGQWGTVGSIINEASSTAGIGFTVSTWAAGGSAADATGKIRVCLVFKNSAASNPA